MRFKEPIKIESVILFERNIIPQIEKLARDFIQSEDIRSRASWFFQRVDLSQEKRKLAFDDDARRVENTTMN